MGRRFLGAGSLRGALGSPRQAWMPEKHLCAAPYLTKTRGGGRLLWWPPREPAHLGCSVATGHLCCQVGLSVALQLAVTSLQDALQCMVHLCFISLGTKIKRERWALLCPHSQGATRETCHPQISCVTWTPCTSCRCGSGRLWGTGKTFCDAPALAESRAGDNGGRPGQSAAGSEAWQDAALAEMPGSLSLGPGAAARGQCQLGLRWENTGRGDPHTLHVYLAPRSDNLSLCPSLPRHPESSTAGPGVVLSCLLTDGSLTSRPKKRKNCPELTCAQVFAGSMVFGGTWWCRSRGALKKQGGCLDLLAGSGVCAAGASDGLCGC